MQYVVFGIDGYIGSYIYQHLKEDSNNVVGTSRRLVNQGRAIYYDIQRDDIGNILSEVNDIDRIAIICIAIPNIDRCFMDYKETYEVNVVSTKRLIHKLTENGFRVIFFSSDNVFDGFSGNYTEVSRTHAINRYGMMKEEMEKYLLQNEPAVCIMRIPKVVSAHKAKQNIFTEWLECAKTGIIKCIEGNRITFVDINDIYHACVITAEKRLTGLYNIAGDDVYSRAELAHKFCDKLGIMNVDIQECDIREFQFKDKRPLNLYMQNLKFKRDTGYSFTPMDATINKYIGNMSFGGGVL